MTARRGLHVADANGEGADAIEARLALAGLFSSFGVLDGGTVSGRSSWAYNVAAAKIVSSRSAADGAVLFANDSTAIVGTNGEGTTIPPAPGTGSRIDIIYVLHRDVDNGDASSLPVFGVASGIASGSPNPPSIPAGAVELARATLVAGATNTAHANVTISHAERPVARLRTPGTIVHSVDSGFPASDASTSAEVVTNRATVSPLPYRRVVSVTGAAYLTSSQSVDIELVVYGGAAVLQRDRRRMVAGIGETLSGSGSFILNAGASAVVEVRHRRLSGTGNVIPSVGSLNTLHVTSEPAA